MTLSDRQRFCSVILKIIVVVSALMGTAISAYAGRDTFMGGKVVFMYFTIQSNLAIAMICAAGLFMLRSDKKIPDLWYLIKYVGTIAITLTGVVFCFILAPTLGKRCLEFAEHTHTCGSTCSIRSGFLCYGRKRHH